ncbi:MAG: type II secretion system secretin GspD [Gammaproteobacteria bacterium]|nr:type II secretion system secretin GspD [Gammaproteobacteria bacterium]
MMISTAILRGLIPVLTALLLSACQSIGTAESDAASQESASPPSTSSSPQPSHSAEVSAASGINPVQQEIVELGSGEFLGDANPEPASQDNQDTGDITLNFQEADLREFIKVILGDMLEENYVVDPSVGGKVTIETSRPLKKSDLLSLLEEVLSLNNAAIVKSGKAFQIVPRKNAARGYSTPSTAQQREAGYTVRIIPLQFIAAQEMQKILEPVLPKDSNLRIDKKRNLVIFSGAKPEVDLVQETVDIFDVDWLRGMSVGLFPLDNVDPRTLKAELDSIIGGMEAEASQELLGGIVRTIPIERLNSILLISSTTAGLREAETWMRRLDRPGASSRRKLYVYDVQNAKAVELAEILGHIFGSATAVEAREPRQPQLAPGLSPAEVTGEPDERIAGQQRPRAAPKPGKPPMPSVQAPASTLDSESALPSQDSIQIIADDVRNALVILASPEDYRMVESAIARLDIVPLQVLIEASIIEVTLRDDLNYGVEWFFKNSIEPSRGKEGRGVLDLGAAGLAAIAPGFSYTIVDNADQVRLALNALEQESELNVLSSPSLMVLDNQTATINVGDEIPVPSRQSTSNIDPNSPTVNEIEFRKTGVTLSVTPRVNAGGLVTMEILQEVSNAVATTTSNIDAPTIQQRQIESVVAVNSGDTIVLGGLIQNTTTNSEGGVPILHKIPIIGKLFGQTKLEDRKTELLVLITPRVVGNRDQAKDVTDEFRRKMHELAPEPRS